MTTYRRFCCNDLLRLGSLKTNSGTPTQKMAYYMYHLATSPGNCHVADAPGGRIAGCIMGHVIGDGAGDIGHVSMLSILHKDLIILLTGKLLQLMEDSCGKIYAMRVFLGPNDSSAQLKLQELGYEVHKDDGERIEMRKRLSRPIFRSPSEDELDRSSTIFKTISESSLEDEQDEHANIDRIESGRLTSIPGRSTSRSSPEDELIELALMALKALD